MLSQVCPGVCSAWSQLSPHQVFYAQEARMYALVSVLTLGTVLAHIEEAAAISKWLRKERELSCSGDLAP